MAMIQPCLTIFAVSTDDKVFAAILVLIVLFVSIKFGDRIREALVILLVVGGGLTVLYGLVKFVRWAWYN
jgi:hypothetical protein